MSSYIVTLIYPSYSCSLNNFECTVLVHELYCAHLIQIMELSGIVICQKEINLLFSETEFFYFLTEYYIKFYTGTFGL